MATGTTGCFWSTQRDPRQVNTAAILQPQCRNRNCRWCKSPWTGRDSRSETTGWFCQTNTFWFTCINWCRDMIKSQTEREALAVRWACERFHLFVYNRDFTVKTDHKPLEKLLSTKSNPPPRIQRWSATIYKLTTMTLSVRWDPITADYLSRYHPFNPKSNEHAESSIDAEHHILLFTMLYRKCWRCQQLFKKPKTTHYPASHQSR